MVLIGKSFQGVKKNIGEIAETFIVLTLGFGLFIYSSTIAIIDNSKVSTTQIYDSYDFVFIVGYEIIILTIIAYFLKYRGWIIKDFNLDFKINLIGIAVLLIIIRETAGALLTHFLTMLGVLNQGLINEPFISIQSNIFSIGLILIINSIYEEVLLIGYFFKRFEKYHPAIIITLSFIIRASYHTYQGWANLTQVFILALVFGLYYLHYKKLWTIIIAHGIGNVYHFLNYYYHWFDT